MDGPRHRLLQPPPGIRHVLLPGSVSSSAASSASRSAPSPPPPQHSQDPSPGNQGGTTSAAAVAVSTKSSSRSGDVDGASSVASAGSAGSGSRMRVRRTPTPTSQQQPPPSSAAVPEASPDGDEMAVVLPGGTQGIRAPILARNWVRRLGNKVQGKPGRFMAVLVDRGRIPQSIVSELERTIGYDPKEHDPVVFFDRRGRRLTGSFGAVLRGTGALWSPQAHREMSKDDPGAVAAFQSFLETDAFNWLECERCGKWRMYPHEDVILPEGALFVCDLAGTWNPAVAGCETEQEYSLDSEQ